MLCDQASDKIFFIYQTASHWPPVLLTRNRPVVNTQGGDQPRPLLLIASVYTTLSYPALEGQPMHQCVKCRVLGRVFDGRSTPW